MSEDSSSKLAGMVDGAFLSEEEGKALWREFSEHMDANRGDMAGFARKKGWFSVLPEYRGGKAVLIVRTTATAKGPPAAPAPPKPRPQQPSRPQQKPQPKPPQKPGARAGQSPPQRPNQPQKPKPQGGGGGGGGGGQTPPKKRSV